MRTPYAHAIQIREGRGQTSSSFPGANIEKSTKSYTDIIKNHYHKKKVAPFLRCDQRLSWILTCSGGEDRNITETGCRRKIATRLSEILRTVSSSVCR